MHLHVNVPVPQQLEAILPIYAISRGSPREHAVLAELFHPLKIISEPTHVAAKQMLTRIIAMLPAPCLMKDHGYIIAGTGAFTCRRTCREAHGTAFQSENRASRGDNPQYLRVNRLTSRRWSGTLPCDLLGAL